MLAFLPTNIRRTPTKHDNFEYQPSAKNYKKSAKLK
jgi:hypothetical protein